jgi:hypothetical protein
MLLNDVQPEQRLAYLLGLNVKLTPSVKRQRTRKFRKAVSAAMLGAGMLVLFSLWEFLSQL